MQFNSSEEEESSALSSDDFTQEDDTDDDIDIKNIISKDTTKVSKRQKSEKVEVNSKEREDDDVLILENATENVIEVLPEKKIAAKKKPAILVDDGMYIQQRNFILFY